MSEDGRDHSLQRITIAIEGQRLSLRVPRALEQRYRLAGEELVRTSQSYHAKYPNVSEVGRQTYLAMSALDVAMRYRELVEQREAHSRHFERRWRSSSPRLLLRCSPSGLGPSRRYAAGSAPTWRACPLLTLLA